MHGRVDAILAPQLLEMPAELAAVDKAVCAAYFAATVLIGLVAGHRNDAAVTAAARTAVALALAPKRAGATATARAAAAAARQRGWTCASLCSLPWSGACSLILTLALAQAQP